jgi:hypothetical protein
MTAIRAAKTAPRERTSPQNGLPEPVPYVYRQQKRRNTYAARIARRNAQEWGQPPAVSAGPDVASSVAIRTWLRAEILAVSTLPEPNTASKAPVIHVSRPRLGTGESDRRNRLARLRDR